MDSAKARGVFVPFDKPVESGCQDSYILRPLPVVKGLAKNLWMEGPFPWIQILAFEKIHFVNFPCLEYELSELECEIILERMRPALEWGGCRCRIDVGHRLGIN